METKLPSELVDQTPRNQAFEVLSPGALDSPPIVVGPVKPDESFGNAAGLTEEDLAPIEKEEEKPVEEPISQSRKGYREMQDRIKKLLGQKAEAQAAVEAERSKVAELERRLQELEGRPQYPLYPQYPQQIPQKSGDPLNPFDIPEIKSAPIPVQNFDPRVLQEVVKRELQPVIQRIEQRDRIDALSGAQAQSWERAAAEFPDIDQAGSQTRAVAEQILSSQPQLRFNPEGPLMAVLMARGLLADQRPERREQARANTGTVVSAGGPLPGDRGPAVAKLEKDIAEIMKAGIQRPEDFVRIQRMRAKLAQLKGK